MPTTKAALDAAKEEAAAQELEADGGEYVTVPLAGYDGVTKDVRVLPNTRWRSSAMRAINGGDIDGFMSLVLHEDDYDIYVDLDPDTEHVQKFAEDAIDASREPMGKSSGPRPSSRGTRRR
ncbi:hypothetical protein ACFWMG_04585 [Streptomyces sp. NPDC127074]|uniref:hypothetical protein n=1 Tax=Streptomyces sp. NPDC127074 TaxID=3347130 RepID=UPI0036626FCD